MGSDRVTCHPTQVNTPAVTPARQAGTRLTYPEGWKAEWLVTHRDVLPVHRRSPIEVLTEHARRDVEPATHWSQVRRPNHYTLPSHLTCTPSSRDVTQLYWFNPHTVTRRHACSSAHLDLSLRAADVAATTNWISCRRWQALSWRCVDRGRHCLSTQSWHAVYAWVKAGTCCTLAYSSSFRISSIHN